LCRLGNPELGTSLGTQEDLATSGRSGAALRALLPDPPQEVLDVHTQDDQAEILDPEADAYANVEASTSLQTWQ